jgi:hypothetical protein
MQNTSLVAIQGHRERGILSNDTASSFEVSRSMPIQSLVELRLRGQSPKLGYGTSFSCRFEAWCRRSAVGGEVAKCGAIRNTNTRATKALLILLIRLSRPAACHPCKIRQQLSSSFTLIDQRRLQANNRRVHRNKRE